MTPQIEWTDIAEPSIRTAIVQPLIAFNMAQTGLDDFRPLVGTLKDAGGSIIGGLWGRTSYEWLFVELLFVPAQLRGQRVGTALMRGAEQEALARGCHNAWLDTFQFQARGFYERIGYSCFAELADYPRGTARYFMKKALTPDAVPPR